VLVLGPLYHLPDADERQRALREDFRVEGLVGVEGPGAFLTDVDDWLDDPQRRDALLRAIRRTETQRALLGARPHLLIIATKPA
jgi:hypothetical protein